MPMDSIVFNTIDLSALPPPQVLEDVTYKQLYEENLAVFAAIEPSYAHFLHSDPIVKLIQAFTYKEFKFRNRVNSAAEALLIAKATGADLDNFAANRNITRMVEVTDAGTSNEQVIRETDEQLRQRLLLKIETFSTAGPRDAYAFFTYSVSPRIAHVNVVTQAPGEVTVGLVMQEPGLLPDNAMIMAVNRALSQDNRIPLTDILSVVAPSVVYTDIVARLTVFYGPDPALILGRANAQLDALLARTRKMGYDLTRSSIIAALTVEGVQNVDLVTPATDVVIDDLHIYQVADRDVTVTGNGV